MIVTDILSFLEESKIYDEVTLALNLPRLRNNVDAITRYAVMEILNNAKVDTVGQSFADEVFRVFTSKHPNTRVTPVGAKAAVAAMMRHVGAST